MAYCASSQDVTAHRGNTFHLPLRRAASLMNCFDLPRSVKSISLRILMDEQGEVTQNAWGLWEEGCFDQFELLDLKIAWLPRYNANYWP